MPRRTPRRAAASFRPRVEGLEDRLAPATFTVTNTNSNGAGSLRSAINQANATTGADTIDFNIPGTGAQRVRLMSALPAVTETVTIDAGTQPGFTTNPLVVLDGRTAGVANGLVIRPGADNCVVRGLVINNFAGNGIVIRSDGNAVRRCYVGTNPAGTRGAPNLLDGVAIAAGASGNTIGGMGSGNLIAANARFGVNISGDGADGNTLATNSIGNNLAGGVQIAAGAENNTVGGTAAGLSNVIGANAAYGVLITGVGTSGNTVSGNFIGTDAAGSKAIANTLDGVAVFDGASNNKIGVAGAGNLISGNGRYGVNLRGEGTTGNVLVANFIGLTGNGAAAIPNVAGGIRVANGADGNTIGGTAGGTTNTISGNKSFGVLVSGADQTVIRGNRIGTAVNGTTALGNASHGVFITNGSSGTAVGGTADGAGNLIANNGGNGVLIGSDPAAGFATAAGTGNSVLLTAFAANGKLGIDLGPNDGPNGVAIPVVVNSAVITDGGAKIDVAVAVTGSAGATFRVEVYASPEADPSGFGEGRFLLGIIQVMGGGPDPVTGTDSFAYAAAAGTKITATVTNLDTNESSEFSAVVTAT